FRCRSRNIQNQAMLQQFLLCTRPKRRNACIILLEIGEVFIERLYARRTKKHNNIVKNVLQVFNVTDYRTKEYGRCKIISVVLQPLWRLLICYIGARKQLLLLAMFLYYLFEVFRCLLAEETLTLAILNIL